jgi:hypothetical protein
MANFGRGSGDYVRPFRNVRVQHYPEAASQTFKRGEVLILGGAGVENQVRIASDNPTAAIVGIAAADATGVTGTKVPVWLAHPLAEFRAKAIAGDAADFTDLNAARAIQKDATNVIWEVDTTDAGNDSVVPLDLLDNNLKQVVEANADTNYWVVFRFADAATIWGSAL